MEKVASAARHSIYVITRRPAVNIDRRGLRVLDRSIGYGNWEPTL